MKRCDFQTLMSLQRTDKLFSHRGRQPSGERLARRSASVVFLRRKFLLLGSILIGIAVFACASQAQSDSLTNLVVFDGIIGGHSYAGLITDGVGNLYGTTSTGGTGGDGIVFKLDAANN